MERTEIEKAIRTIKCSEVMCLNGGHEQFEKSVRILIKVAEQSLSCLEEDAVNV